MYGVIGLFIMLSLHLVRFLMFILVMYLTNGEWPMELVECSRVVRT